MPLASRKGRGAARSGAPPTALSGKQAAFARAAEQVLIFVTVQPPFQMPLASPERARGAAPRPKKTFPAPVGEARRRGEGVSGRSAARSGAPPTTLPGKQAVFARVAEQVLIFYTQQAFYQFAANLSHPD